MGKFVYNALTAIFGSSLTEDIVSFMSLVISGMSSFFKDGGQATTVLAIFTGVAGSLMTIYLFMDIMDKASKDMVTLERLILIFVKYLFGMVILIYLPEIVNYLFKLAKGIYDVVGNKNVLNLSVSGAKIKYFGSDKWPDYSMVSDIFEKKSVFGKGVKSITNNLGLLFTLMLTYLLSFGARFAAFFIAISNAVTLITRTIFAPLGVVQCFDEGQRSAGIRYLKKFAAEALTFAVIVGILFAAGQLQNAVLAGILKPYGGELTTDNVQEILGSFKMMGSIIVIQLASLGGMMKAGQLANDIVGTH
jgi:hypothetical protein